MSRICNRREMLRLTGRAALAATLGSRLSFAAESGPAAHPHGAVVGEETAAKIGEQVLADGGNAVDAIVAAALTAAVVSPHNCGIGGYGGSMVIALAGKKTTAIDFNTAAPAAARADMFPLDEHGAVRDQINDRGWLASGVPGTLAGLHLAQTRYGTRSFREAIGPALALARDGYTVSTRMAKGTTAAAAQLRKDPISARLYLKDGEPPQAGETLRNPDLARMLETLAEKNSVEPFYRGDIARHIAGEFQKHGGLVTIHDLAAYQAREVRPLEFQWRGFTLRTAPLTAGGLTVLEALSFLKALNWDAMPATPARTHARLEALRIAWGDRLQLLGDPAKVKVPVARLLSTDYAREVAKKIKAAVKDRKPVPANVVARPHVETVHLSCADKRGNLAVLTLTHGNLFGARVTVDGLGLTLGHGMSRFDPLPGHPNAPGPGKRPLHNMCPTVVLRGGRPVFALGGAGGRKIPNSIFDVLTHFITVKASLEEAIAAPRLHTEGMLDLTLENTWPLADAEFLQTLGYTVKSGAGAVISAVSFDPKTGECRAAQR